MTTPIEISPALKAEIAKEKVTAFKSGLEKLEKETGMTMIAVLQPSADKIQAVCLIVPNKDNTIQNS